MTPRRKALLEAALMCSQFADKHGNETAALLADKLERLAESPLHFYPPGKPVIDLRQDSENSQPKKSGAYNLTDEQWADF